MMTVEIGFRAPEVCRVTGLTYRQVDYWARVGLLTPSIQEAQGSGSQRVYSMVDLVQASIMKQMLNEGATLHRIRPVLSLSIDWANPIGSQVILVGPAGATLVDEDTLLDELWASGLILALSPAAVARRVRAAVEALTG